MQIGGLGSVPNVPSPQPGKSPEPVDSQQPAEPNRSEDTVEISAETANGETASAPGVRELRLAQIKAQIEAGEYDTDDKFEAALSRMLEGRDLDDD